MKIYLRLFFTFLYIVSQCDFYNAEYGVIDSKKTTIRKLNTEEDDCKNNEGYQKSCEEQDKLLVFTDKSFKDEVSGDQYEARLRPPRGEHVLDELLTTKDDSSETDNDETDNDETDTLKYRFRGLKQRQVKRQKYNDAKETAIFEYPPLHRITPHETGAHILLKLQPEINHTRITRATNPPVFEIPNFLSDEECEMIKEKAEEKGLKPSHIFGSDVEDESKQTSNISNIPRLSSTAWIDNNHIGQAFYSSFVSRLARLTEVPVDVIKRSEYLQVVKYEEGGHYHAHIDSHEISNLPCCFQSYCTSLTNEVNWTLCCRPCRFMTVLIYLNDVHSGGQTVFPFADLSEQEIQVVKSTVPDWKNLGLHCHDSSLALQPKKGTAVMWYNHFLDREIGYLSTLDKRSAHGSCDVERGIKWVANLWIAFPTYMDRFKPSVYFS